jgi:hypothetical protein
VSLLIRWLKAWDRAIQFGVWLCGKRVLDGCYLTVAFGMSLGSIKTKPVNVPPYS